MQINLEFLLVLLWAVLYVVQFVYIAQQISVKHANDTFQSTQQNIFLCVLVLQNIGNKLQFYLFFVVGLLNSLEQEGDHSD